MPYFTFRGKRIHYHEAGDDNHDVAILLHGNMSNHKRWLPLISLMKKRMRCYAIDFPGSGRSEDLDSFHSLDLLAECAEALISNVKAREFILLGHSMGGGVAQLTALKNLTRARALILINSISFNGFADFYNQKDYIASMHRNKKLLKEMFDQSFPDYYDPSAIDEMIEDAYNSSRRVFTDEPKAMFEFNIRDSVNLLVMPTLIMRTRGDLIVTERDVIDMYRAFPNSVCAELDGSTHSPHFEDPASVHAVIENFLNQSIQLFEEATKGQDIKIQWN